MYAEIMVRRHLLQFSEEIVKCDLPIELGGLGLERWPGEGGTTGQLYWKFGQIVLMMGWVQTPKNIS